MTQSLRDIKWHTDCLQSFFKHFAIKISHQLALLLIKYRLVTFPAYHCDFKQAIKQLFLPEDFKEAFAFQ